MSHYYQEAAAALERARAAMPAPLQNGVSVTLEELEALGDQLDKVRNEVLEARDNLDMIIDHMRLLTNERV